MNVYCEHKKQERPVCLHDCTAVEFSRPIKELDSGKSNGIDEFSIEHLKSLAQVSSQTLLVNHYCLISKLR